MTRSQHSPTVRKNSLHKVAFSALPMRPCSRTSSRAVAFATSSPGFGVRHPPRGDAAGPYSPEC